MVEITKSRKAGSWGTQAALMEKISHFFWGAKAGTPTFYTEMQMRSDKHSGPLLPGCVMSQIIEQDTLVTFNLSAVSS